MTHERSRRGRWFSAWTTLVAAVGFLHVADDSGADQPKIEPKPINILLIVADDLRADVMSVYGGPVKTPQLERLAAGGTLFRRATCGYPICHVSRSEILTGRVLVSEAAKGGAVSFAKSWTLWPQRMKDAGWHTVHLGKWHVDGTPQSCGYTQHAAMYGIGRLVDLPLTFPLSATGKRVTGYVGWIFKDDDNRPLPELGVGLTPGTDDRISDGAAEVIRQRTNEALFVHVNLTAPHDPLLWPDGPPGEDRATSIALPKNFAAAHPFNHGNIAGRDETIVPAPRTTEDVQLERAVYYAIVEKLDQRVGRMLQAIEQSADPTNWLVVFTSDQGLALGSHGLMGKQNQYDHTINTPLIISGPELKAGQKLDAQCALRDLYPTVCDLMGLSIPDSVQGKSLLPLLGGKTSAGADEVYGYFTDSQRMLRTADGWKLIWYPKIDRVQLFHVANDGDELIDLANEPTQRDRRQTMLARLKDWIALHDNRAARH